MISHNGQPHEPITVAVLNYNGRNILKDTILSIQEIDYPEIRVILVDDGSTDGSVEMVEEDHPDIRVIRMDRNTKMLNQVRNRAISSSETNFILLTDNDITFKPDCLKVFMETMRVRPEAAVLTPRVMYEEDKRRIYIDYNRYHYVCASIDRNRDKLIDQVDGDNRLPSRSFGCGIMFIDKSKAARVGFFDGDFVMGWGDDGEFHHRVNLSGFACYSVPDAVIYHKAIRGAPRVYGQLRNRWFMILTTYSCRTLVVIAPALILYEFSLFIFMPFKGTLGQYLRAVRDVVINFRSLLGKRKIVQSYRTIPDKELMTADKIYITHTHTGSALLRTGMAALNSILNAYWRLARRML